MTGRETFACPYCGERFLRKGHQVLHIGRVHPDEMEAAEQVAFEAALAEEDVWFQRLQKHIRAGFVVLPVFLMYVLTVVLLYQAEGNPAFAIMLFPGFVAFSVLLYGMTLSYLTVREQRKNKVEE